MWLISHPTQPTLSPELLSYPSQCVSVGDVPEPDQFTGWHHTIPFRLSDVNNQQMQLLDTSIVHKEDIYRNLLIPLFYCIMASIIAAFAGKS